jgi:hypothetical protein
MTGLWKGWEFLEVISIQTRMDRSNSSASIEWEQSAPADATSGDVASWLASANTIPVIGDPPCKYCDSVTISQNQQSDHLCTLGFWETYDGNPAKFFDQKITVRLPPQIRDVQSITMRSYNRKISQISLKKWQMETKTPHWNLVDFERLKPNGEK